MQSGSASSRRWNWFSSLNWPTACRVSSPVERHSGWRWRGRSFSSRMCYCSMSRSRREMRVELRRLQRAVGITFLFVTHDQEEALTLSDGIAVMNSGKLEQVGTPEEIYRSPRSRFVASFVGSSNLIEGKVTRVEHGHVDLTTPTGRCFSVPCPPSPPCVGSLAGLLVRSEAIQIANGSAPPRAQKLTGKIVQSMFLGPHRQIVVQVDPEIELTVLCPAATPLPDGSSLELWWNPEDCLILPG